MNGLRKIPYSNFKEKVDISKRELSEGRRIEIRDGFIYSFPKNKTVGTSKNLKCKECGAMVGITTNRSDILVAVCPGCGGDRLDYMDSFEEKYFKRLVR